MCGIAGYAGGNYPLADLKRMNRALTHRGPDDEGYFLAPGAGLAMRRLSIIDVKGGHQPMANADESVWTVFNGEIYNFQELRQDLLKKGYRFRTHHSDTETIVHAYQEYGPNFVTRLNGMFAIAIWDMRRRRLLLYRDRTGEKPLYLWPWKNSLFFASEIKSFLTLPFFTKKFNEKALFYYLSLKNSPRRHSFFQGVESLNPGEYLIFEKGQARKKTYWEIDASRPLRISEEDAAAEILRLLKDSVKYRMISDVPLGAYLSGGVDSSAVVGLMSRIRKKPVETFSLTYADTLAHKEKDQYWAFAMSKRFHTRHREYRMRFAEFDRHLGEVIRSFDEPFGGTISTFFLSKLIRKHVTVAVSGDGADELFGSYKIHRMAYPLHHLNEFRRRGIALNGLNARQKSLLGPFADNPAELLKIPGTKPFEWHASLGVFQDEEKNQLLTAKVLRKTTGESIRNFYRAAYQRVKTDDVLNQVLQVECQNLLPDQVLSFVDKLSMAHSVEVRPPFLDHRLVEFAFRLPGTLKIRNGINKFILKKAVRGLLPKELIERPKEGFILPYHFWMREYMCDRIAAVLSPRQLDRHGLFNPRYVADLLTHWRGGGLEAANKVFLLFVFQLWWDEYFN